MPDIPLVSVVMPVWRDAAALGSSLRLVEGARNAEVIVCHALGDAAGYATLRQRHRTVRWIEAPRGRGIQMNAGAAAARGRWLLFLHADSSVPAGWLEAIRDADGESDIVAGAYRLRLDTSDWRARLIEARVRMRVALFNMPYGDQGLFVRRDVFARLGGYRNLPLMEDVDLVRRLRRLGRFHHDWRAITTSPRRWERDGWFRRSAGNIALTAAFLAGVPARTLARIYHRRLRHAIVMMARAPWLPGKSRLAPDLTPEAHAELRTALFFDTLDAARAVHGAQCIVACEPPGACAGLLAMLPPGIDVIAQRGGSLGQRMAAVFDDVFRLGHEGVVVIGSDLPDLPAARLKQALRALARKPHGVVIGPADDGGYYLIGLQHPAAAVFANIEWGSSSVLGQTLERAAQARLPAVLLEPWQDVDDANDLRALAARGAAASSGARCREWLRMHGREPA
jgi:rSAM/selenodomain-associated transferase 2/rSAM/selenodomain-associated transferase 1